MLTDAAIRKATWRAPLSDDEKQAKRAAAARGEKTPPGNKLSDERGLFLLLTPAGGKLWRLKYRFGGREKLLALGAYPDVSLSQARDRRDEARKLVASGIDPAAQRRLTKQSDDAFEAVAREWFGKFSPKWAESYRRTVIGRLEMNVFPHLGRHRINDITAPELLAVLRRIENRGALVTTSKVRRLCSMIFRYAVASGYAERDPSADLRGAFATAPTEHRAAITDPKEAGPLLRALDAYDGTLVVCSALRLAPLVFVRPGELRKAEWSEIDLDKARWTLPPWRTKMRQPLIVPLSRQAVAILQKLRPVTGDGKYVFPSARSAARPMSDNAILAALRRSGIEKDEMSGHGFRALARTILDEELHVRVDLIEHQLGHAVKDPNGRAYNRTSFLQERVAMMQQWSDYLDSLKAGTAASKQA